MEDNKIIKALECCRDAAHNPDFCYECPYDETENCTILFAQDTLNLINRQQAKIEALQMDNEQLQIDIINANINLEHQQKEIEQLKTNNTLLRQDINADTAEIRALRRKFDIAKFEAVREFAEKLKSLINQHHYILASIHNSKDFGMFTVGIEQAVDSVVKEMVGDTE